MEHQRENFLSSKSCGGTQPLREDCLRTPLIGALALTLVGCSRQPPPQTTDASCVSPNQLACFMAVGLPMPLDITFRGNSARSAPAHDKAAARAEITARPAKLAGPNKAGPHHHSRNREVEPRVIRTRATKARHLTCRGVSETPCALRIPVCPATADQGRACTPATPAFQRRSRPLSA